MVGLNPFPLVTRMFLLREIPESKIQHKVILKKLIFKQTVPLNSSSFQFEC
jgi:hypothetical protein